MEMYSYVEQNSIDQLKKNDYSATVILIYFPKQKKMVRWCLFPLDLMFLLAVSKCDMCARDLVFCYLDCMAG